MQVLPPDENPAMVAVGVFRGYIENVEGTGQTAATSGASSAATGATSQTTAALGTGQPSGATPAYTTVTVDEANQLLTTYPNTPEGADNLLVAKGITAQQALDDPILQEVYGAEFKQRLTETATLEQAAGEEEVAEYGTDQQMKALKVIRSMMGSQLIGPNPKIKKLEDEFNISNEEATKLFESLSNVEFSREQQLDQAKNIIDTVMGSNLAEARAIAKELDVPIDYAKRLHAQATGSTLARGGLMSRS
jgi:hypothetical protein